MTELVVTNRDKIKYLKRYILLDREINRKLEEVSRWRVKLTRVTAIYTAEPKGGGSIRPREEAIIAKIVDLEQEINASIDRLIDIRQEIGRVIESVEDDKKRVLLQYRYLDGRTFEWIAANMDFSWRWVHALHKQTLTDLEIKVCIEVHI